MSSSSARPLLLALAGLLLSLGAPAQADIFRLGTFDFVAGEDAGDYELTASVPEAADTGGTPVWPEGCAETKGDRIAGGTEIRFAYRIHCTRTLSAGDTVQTPWAVDGGTLTSSVTGRRITRTVQPEGDTVTLPIGETAAPVRTAGAIAKDYTREGVFHILGGWDHLAFVLCLCLLARGRTLLLLVTTFTLGHSVSLALAFFDVVHMPVPPVEAVIALSIAFMAREALRGPPGGDIAPDRRRRYLAVVGGFGLLHGLGFATALREMGIAPAERLSGLVFFNVGVEMGQLLFVGCVLAVMAGARSIGRAEPARAVALYGAGTIGCFWMIERVLGFTALAA